MNEEEKQFEQLIDYINGQLSPEEQSTVKKQIDNDPALQKMITVLQGVQDDVNKTKWDKLQKSSHALFDRLLNDIKKKNSENDKIRGVTVYDSGLMPLPDGVRPAKIDTRRLKYIIDKGHLELSVYPVSPNSYELIGQLSGLGRIKSLTVELQGSRSRLTVKANEFNLFRIPRVQHGNYSLNLLEEQKIIGKIDIEL